MSEVVFRKMIVDDIDAVFEIETTSFSHPWSRQSLCDEMENERALYIVAVAEDKPIAYMGTWLIFDEAHVTNVAVLPQYRRLGIGQKLLRHMIDILKHKGICSMTLEVRESNFPAQAMYQKLGFEAAGIRKNYYEDTKENAIIMWLNDIG